ncbi:MAG: hypothetical protein ABJA78_10120 [Ferruginibacter sp.]
MKKLMILSVICCSTIFLQAQVKKATAPAGKNPHLNVFNQALQCGDVPTAILALNYYISEQNGNTPYADTVAMLYLRQGAFAQCYYWADKRLALKPEDIGLMEMKAICLDKMQQPTESIALFEKLFKKTQSPFHGYKLMELQYGLKRLVECIATAQATEKLQFKPDYIMPYTVGEQSGRTYLQSGVYNIHALALYDLDKKAEAKSYFEKALALDSTFLLAKQNLEAMKSLENPSVKSGQPQTTIPMTSPGNKQN